MSKIALITGINGQDGSYLAELLLKKKYKVHGLVRKKLNNKNKNDFWRLQNIYKKIKFHYLNSYSYKNLFKLIKNIYPNEVYHLAAQAYDGYSFENEFYTLETNLGFTHKILSSTRRVNPKAKFFFAGSSEMFNKNIKKKLTKRQNLILNLRMELQKLLVIILYKVIGKLIILMLQQVFYLIMSLLERMKDSS